MPPALLPPFTGGGPRLTQADQAHSQGFTGRGVTGRLLDSGYNLHSYFKNKVGKYQSRRRLGSRIRFMTHGGMAPLWPPSFWLLPPTQ